MNSPSEFKHNLYLREYIKCEFKCCYRIQKILNRGVCVGRGREAVDTLGEYAPSPSFPNPPSSDMIRAIFPRFDDDKWVEKFDSYGCHGLVYEWFMDIVNSYIVLSPCNATEGSRTTHPGCDQLIKYFGQLTQLLLSQNIMRTHKTWSHFACMRAWSVKVAFSILESSTAIGHTLNTTFISVTSRGRCNVFFF